MANNYIGPHNFDLLQGPPAMPGQAVRVTTRAGFDGHQAMKIGRRGPVWRPMSIVYVANVDAARDLLYLYTQERGKNAVGVKYDSTSLSKYGLRWFVLDVEPIEIAARSLVVGDTISATPGAVLKARWTLQGVEIV